jgi:hypothetical protein
MSNGPKYHINLQVSMATATKLANMVREKLEYSQMMAEISQADADVSAKYRYEARILQELQADIVDAAVRGEIVVR